MFLVILLLVSVSWLTAKILNCGGDSCSDGGCVEYSMDV